MRRALAAVAAVAAAFAASAVGVLSVPVAAAEEAGVEKAWWWRAQTGLVAMPVPPHVPEGGLVVGQGVDGPTAVSALRVAVPSPGGNVVLTLEVERDTSTAPPAVEACITTDEWHETAAGAWDDRPVAACHAGRAPGSAQEDGATWSFDVTDLVRRGTLDVVLVPRAGAETERLLPFELVFVPPPGGAVVASPDASAVDEPLVSPPPGRPAAAPPRSSAPPPAAAWLPRDSAAIDVPAAEPGAPRASPMEAVRFGRANRVFDGRDRLTAAALAAGSLAAMALVWRRMGVDGRERGVARFVAMRRGAPPPL